MARHAARSDGRPLAARRWAASLIVVAAFACGGAPQMPVWEDVSPPETRTPAPTTAEASERFADAETLYATGRVDDALASFQLFAAEFPGDALAARAELYIGRLLVTRGDLAQAERVFADLSDAPESEPIRDAAALYVGFVAAFRGASETADEAMGAALRRNPDVDVPEGWVVAGDEALLGSLLAEARIARGEVLRALDDLSLVWRTGDPVLREYAWARAREQARQLSARDLELAAASGDPFLTAATGEPRHDARVASGDAAAAADVAAEATTAAELIGVALALPAQTASASGGAATQGEPRYGLLLTLSGPNRRAGRAALGGALLAQRAFEDREAASMMLVEDTYGSAEGTEAAVRTLVAAGAVVIVGPIESELAEVARREAATSGVPLLALSPARFDAARGASFRWMADPTQEATAAVARAREAGAQRFFIIDDGGAAPFMATFAAAAEGAAGEVTDRASFDVRDGAPRDLQERAADVARRVAASNADGVIIAVADEAAASLLAHLAAAGVGTQVGRRVQIVLTSFAMTPALLLNSARYAQGAIFPYWFDAALATDDARLFAERFEYTYGRPAGTIEAFAYDAARAARSLVADEMVRRPDAAAARLSMGVAGQLFGELRFDAAGNHQAVPRLATVAGERFVVLE